MYKRQLYIQVADAIHAIDPELKLGGPCFQTTINEYKVWPIGNEKRTWMTRFLSYLKERNHEKDYSFFSFEWYPFDQGCISTAPQLAAHPDLLRGVIAVSYTHLDVYKRQGKAQGIRVNGVAPGAVDTEMLRKAAPHLRTHTGPADVAKVIAFLCDSAESGCMSGATLVINSNE